MDYLVPTVYEILTHTQTGTSWMAPPCLDRQSEFTNSKCFPGNLPQDQFLAKTSVTWLSILYIPTHRSALWVTALSDVGLSLSPVKKGLPSDPSSRRGHLQPLVSKSQKWFLRLPPNLQSPRTLTLSGIHIPRFLQVHPYMRDLHDSVS